MSTRKKINKIPYRYESQFQREANRYLRLVLVNRGRGWFEHFHEAEKRGVKGAPDLFIWINHNKESGKEGGLFFTIELKVCNNKPTPAQEQYMLFLEKCGIQTNVCRDFGAFTSVVNSMLEKAGYTDFPEVI